MRTLVALAVSLSTAVASAEGPDDRPRIPEDFLRRPAVVRPTYSVRVQAEPRLPKDERPDASTPAGDGRLSLTIQPERKSFPGNGPVAYTVTLTNKSEKSILLYGAEKLGRRPDMVFVHQKTAGQSRMTGDWDTDFKAAPLRLDSGKSYTRTFVIESQAVAGPVPLPRPEPIPFPLPGPRPELRRDAAPKAAAPAPPVRKGEREAERMPLIAAPAVIADVGTVRTRLMLEFTAPAEAAKGPDAVWTGKIASDPVDVEFTIPVWKGVPGIPPGGPVTKEQAITVAHQAAEAALNSAYDPIDPVRPAHSGPWIADPQKTATVKEKANAAGWSISWTHTAKGKGHTHHVVVDVDANGRTNIREVFAGYSNR